MPMNVTEKGSESQTLHFLLVEMASWDLAKGAAGFAVAWRVDPCFFKH